MRITLANLPEASAQQVFDQVARHLLAQGKRCMVIHENTYTKKTQPGCAYRSEDGKLACAAGCLISDEEMVEVHDQGLNHGHGWMSLIDAGIAPHAHYELIRRLQEMHDDEEIEDWKYCLGVIAKEHKLTEEALY